MHMHTENQLLLFPHLYITCNKIRSKVTIWLLEKEIRYSCGDKWVHFGAKIMYTNSILCMHIALSLLFVATTHLLLVMSPRKIQS